MKDFKGYTIGQDGNNVFNLLSSTMYPGPGPGQYNIDRKFPSLGGTGKFTSPKFSFTKEVRHQNTSGTAGLPAPASYTPSLKHKGPAITIAIKTPAVTTGSKINTPGPGQYHIQSSFEKFDIYTQPLNSTKSRMRLSKGSFAHQSVENLKIEIVKDVDTRSIERLIHNKTEHDVTKPSPSRLSAIKGAARKTITSMDNHNPGPGAYETQYGSIYKKAPNAFMGSAIRPDLTSKDIRNTPGPNNYLPNIDKVKKAAANWTIKTKNRYNTPEKGDNKNTQIGPGSYNINSLASSELKNPPRVFITTSFKNEAKFVTSTSPSPMEYSPSLSPVKKKSPTYKIGSQPQRVPLAQKAQLESPGPSQYFQNVQLAKLVNYRGRNVAPEYSIGKATRDSMNKRVAIGPGPGQYSIPPAFGNVASYDRASMN